MRRAVALIAVLLVAMPAAAGAAAPRVSFNALEQQVMCVQCRIPLNIAQSDQADQERRELHRLIDLGDTRKQVLAGMVDAYGPGVLAKPKDDGFSLVAWIVPIGVSIGLIALGIVLIGRWRRARRDDDDGDGPAAAGPLAPDEARRLDEDMARVGV